jgi:hypothetical protein
MIQGTRPRTAAAGLRDSPTGLAGWLIEKFREWRDCGGDIERCYSKDELLTNTMIYWWAERFFNVQRWTATPRGGHFAALEQPASLAEELREFFRPLRRDGGGLRTGKS